MGALILPLWEKRTDKHQKKNMEERIIDFKQ